MTTLFPVGLRHDILPLITNLQSRIEVPPHDIKRIRPNRQTHRQLFTHTSPLTSNGLHNQFTSLPRMPRPVLTPRSTCIRKLLIQVCVLRDRIRYSELHMSRRHQIGTKMSESKKRSTQVKWRQLCRQRRHYSLEQTLRANIGCGPRHDVVHTDRAHEEKSSRFALTHEWEQCSCQIQRPYDIHAKGIREEFLAIGMLVNQSVLSLIVSLT